MSSKTCGNAVHFAVQNAAFGPNMRQNMRRRRSFRRSKRHFWPKYAAKHAAAPFIPPAYFKFLK
jgi:hypothetical protein